MNNWFMAPCRIVRRPIVCLLMCGVEHIARRSSFICAAGRRQLPAMPLEGEEARRGITEARTASALRVRLRSG